MNKKFVLFLIFLFIKTGFSQVLSLDECVNLALKSNPNLRKSQYALDKMNLSTKQAYSDLYPSLSASANTSNNGPFIDEPNDEWSWSASANLSQSFYHAGMYSGIKLAKAQEMASELSDQSLEDQIVATVEQLYFQILASDTSIRVYKENIRLADEQIDKMEQMVELGMKRESDLLKSKVTRGTFESQLVQTNQTLATYKRSLNLVMGRSPSTKFEIIPVDVDQPDVPDYQSALEQMIQKNPDIKQLKAQIDIEKLSLLISKEAYLPSISGNYSASKRSDLTTGTPVNNDQVSLNVSLPIFDGFSKKLNVQKSKVNLSEAELDYTTAMEELIESLLAQYHAYETENQLIRILQTNLASARKDLEVVSEQYASGFSSILDLTDSQVSVLESEINLLKELYARKRIEIEIRRLMGT